MRTLSDVLRLASDRPGGGGRRPLLAAVAVLFVLAGCGGEPESAATPPAPPSTVAASPPSAPPSSSSAMPTSASPTPAPSRTPTATPSPTGRATPASTADGTYAGELSLSEDGALSYVPLRWYTEGNAKARCREKKVAAEGAWCTEYYYEKTGGRKAAALREDTRVRLLNDDLKPVDGSLADLVQAIDDEVWPNFQIAVDGGQVRRITQVFTP